MRISRDRQAALDLAAHSHAIRRALELTSDAVEQQALIRFGPVPATCQQCRQAPPTTILMVGSGQWLCSSCAHGTR